MSIHSDQIPFVVGHIRPLPLSEFASRWLAAAVDADRILALHRSTNPDFERAIERLGLIYLVEFSWAAMAFISFWQDQPACILFRSTFDPNGPRPSHIWQEPAFSHGPINTIK